MTSKTYTTTIVRESGMCFIPVPFDPVAARAPSKRTSGARGTRMSHKGRSS